MNIETKIEDLLTGFLYTETLSGTAVNLNVAFDDDDFHTPAVIVAVLESEEREYGSYHGGNPRRNSGNFTLKGMIDIQTNYGDTTRAGHEALVDSIRTTLHCESILEDLNDFTTGLYLYDFLTTTCTREVAEDSNRSTKLYFSAVVKCEE